MKKISYRKELRSKNFSKKTIETIFCHQSENSWAKSSVYTLINFTARTSSKTG